MNREDLIPLDDIGFSTLMNISKAHRLNTWMFESIQPYLNGKILEIGSGIGNLSSILVEHKIPLYLSDYSQEYCRFLEKKFAQTAVIKGIFQIDLVDKAFESTHAHLLGTFDTIFSLNVIEHIENDQLAIENCYKLLAPGGRLVILMPAYPALYNRFDRELGHCRRYTRQSINQLLSTHFRVTQTKYFNSAGIFGWFLFGSLLRQKKITGKHMDIFEKLVPLFRLTDKITASKIGLSVIGVGEKPV